LNGDEHAEVRDVMREVHRAIQRIDDPTVGPIGPQPGRLFGKNCVIGIATADAVEDVVFGCTVGVGHQVDGALVGDREALGIGALEQLAALPRKADRQREKIVRRRGAHWLFARARIASNKSASPLVLKRPLDSPRRQFRAVSSASVYFQ